MVPDQVEIEVKFLIDDIARMRSRLIGMGASTRGEIFETNFRYDDHAGRLLKAQCLLRLRKDRRALLTFKRPRPDKNADFKIYDEYEVVVEDFGRMDQILNALGFQRAQVYEKRRETFHAGDTLVCIDRLPFGHFVEIEGPPEGIRDTARQLKLPWKRRILTNYLRIFEALREELDLTFTDLTFDNIKTVPDRADGIIRRFEAAAMP